MNVRTSDTVSSAHSSNITTPGAGGQVTNSVPQAYPFPYDIFGYSTVGKIQRGNASEAGKLFMDWIEQFELVASACHWDDRAKLVNLTTRLRGQAFAFYRSCSTQQRNNYTILVSKLKKCFTPLRLQAVQSSLFHDRKQSQMKVWMPMLKNCVLYFTMLTLKHSKEHRRQNKWPAPC